jgi:hypothetical protein
VNSASDKKINQGTHKGSPYAKSEHRWIPIFIGMTNNSPPPLWLKRGTEGEFGETPGRAATRPYRKTVRRWTAGLRRNDQSPLLPLDEEETKKGFLKLVNLGKTRLHPHLLLIRCFPER